MERLLLVDDEILTLKTLGMLVQTELPDVEVYYASNALEAIKTMQSFPCDVVVTDVMMPKVSGIELMETILERWPNTYVIILTAYESFDNAYKANQHDNVRFMLKIEAPNKILAAIKHAFERVHMQLSWSMESEKVKEHLPEIKPILKKTILDRYFLWGGKWADEQENTYAGINIREGKETFLLMSGFTEDEVRLQVICYAIEESLRPFSLHIEKYYSKGRALILIQAESDAGKQDLEQMIQTQLERILSAQKDKEAKELSFVMTERFQSWDNILPVYDRMLTYQKQHSEKSRIVILPEMEKEAKRGIIKRCMLRWELMLEQDDIHGFLQDLDKVYSNIGMELTAFQRIIIPLLAVLLEEKYEVQVSSAYEDIIAMLMSSTNNIEEWLQSIGKVLEMMASNREDMVYDERKLLIVQINRYITEHMMESLNTSEIAKQFGYNASYLSRIYKEISGEGLNETINAMRIDEACRRLRYTSDSIQMIADACGFQTSKYFITVFKKFKGLTPNEWKKQVQN